MVDSSRVFVGVIFLVLSLPIYSQVIASNEDASSDDLNPEFEFEWVREEFLARWDYTIFENTPRDQKLQPPRGLSISSSGNFIVASHDNGCVSLIWTNMSIDMQLYCQFEYLWGDYFTPAGRSFASVAFSPDETFLAICLEGKQHSPSNITSVQVVTVPIGDVTSNTSTWVNHIFNGIFGLGGENLLVSRYNYSTCDSIGFHNNTGDLVVLFDNNGNEAQGSLVFNDPNLCCTCCNYFIVNETTGEGHTRAVNRSGFEMDQIGNVTWSQNLNEHVSNIWVDTTSGEYGYGGINNTMLQNNPDFLERMVNGGIIYLKSDTGLSEYTIRMKVDSSHQIDNNSNEGISDELFIFLFLIALFILGIIGNETAAEEAEAKEREERLLRIKERNRKQKLAETRKANRAKWKSRKTKLREIADGVFTSIDDFRVDLDDGELFFSVKGRRLYYRNSLTRSYKSIEEEMKEDLNQSKRNYSRRSDGLSIRNIVDIATGPFCPNGCPNRLEGGPGGRSRWLCINCGFMFDRDGNAI